MTITDKLMATGDWAIRLRGLPRRIADQLDHFSHVAITPVRAEGPELGDELLDWARYVGVLRRRQAEPEETLLIGGAGLAVWLGDEDGKGAVIESKQSFSASTFAATIRALLPSSVAEGTLHAVAGSYTGDHQWQSPREAIDYVCDVFGAEWRVSPDSTNGVILDAGEAADLFTTTPTALLVRRADPGLEPTGLRILEAGDGQREEDAEDYTTRVVLLAEGEGEAVSTGSADAVSVPYKDLRGNTVALTRLVSESGTSSANAASRAQLALNRFSGQRRRLSLSTLDYDVQGHAEPGDTVYVYDPDLGLVDTANEVRYRGEVIHPIALRVRGVTWSVVRGMGVYHRDKDGNWTDLTEYAVWESSERGAILEVGDKAVSLLEGGEPIGVRTNTGDPSVPDQVTGLSLSGTNYIDADGATKVRIRASWSQPLNTDASTIVDGSYYEIQHKRSSESEWASTTVGFDTTTLDLTDLSTGVAYDVRVRAVDSANPPNRGAWSATSSLTVSDSTAPSTPAAPSLVAGSPQRVQVTHTLGKSTGGTYNLESDLSHLEVHVGASTGFTPSSSTHVGDMEANAGMLALSIPAIGDFAANAQQGDQTRYVKVIAVDRAGNKSAASAAASATVTLVETAYIADATITNAKIDTVAASKVTAATFKGGQFVLAQTAGATSIIKSESYDGTVDANGRLNLDGTTGLAIDGFGNAEFNDALFRGTLGDTTIDGDLTMIGGEINTGRLSTDPIIRLGATFGASTANLLWVDTAGATVGGFYYSNTSGSDLRLEVKSGTMKVYPSDDFILDFSQNDPFGNATSEVVMRGLLENTLNGSSAGFTLKQSPSNVKAVQWLPDADSGDGTILWEMADSGGSVRFRVNHGGIEVFTANNGNTHIPHSNGNTYLSVDEYGAVYFRDYDSVGASYFTFAQLFKVDSGGSDSGRFQLHGTDPAIYFTDSGNLVWHDTSANELRLRNSGTDELVLSTTAVVAPNVYSLTTASAANVHVASDGKLYRSTSSARYKQNIKPKTQTTALDLTVVEYDAMEGNPTRGLPLEKTGRRLIGFTAENVAEVFPEAAVYDEDGRPEAYDHQVLLAALYLEVQQLRRQMERHR